MNHKDSLIKSEKCGCYYCLEVYDSKDIKDWTDDGQTALCAKCGIDAVLPEITNKDLLIELKKYYF